MKEIRRRLTAIFFSLVMVLSVISPGTLATVRADTTEPYVYLTVERSTLGMGVVLAPVKVSYTVGDNFNDWLYSALESSKIATDWSSEYPVSGGLNSVTIGSRPADWAMSLIPEGISKRIELTTSIKSSKLLTAGDYYGNSQWAVSFDDKNSNDYVGRKMTSSDNGVVVRVQFSLDSCKDLPEGSIYSEVIGSVDKLSLIKALANYSDKDSENYTRALAIFEDWDATQDEVDTALGYLSIAAHAHEPVKGEWCYDDTGNHWRKCYWGDDHKLNDGTWDWDSHTSYYEWVVTTPATTTSTGIKSYKCTVCGYVQKTEEISMLSSTTEHTHVAGTTWSSDATNHWQTCTAGDGEKMNSAAHTFGGWTVTKAATEDEEGSQTRKCTVCGYSETQTIAKLSHTHTAADTWQKDDDNHWKLCVKNDGTILEQASHTYGDWEIVTQATEDATGSQKHTCTVCGYEQTETIDKLTHVHTAGTTWSKDADYHWKTCTKNDGEVLYKVSHSFDAWETVKEATEDAVGSQKRTCTVCGYEQTEEIPKEEHVHTADTENWENNATMHWNNCVKNDGEKMNLDNHDFTAWETIEEATSSTEGKQRRTCSVCGYVEETVIPVLGHTHTEDTSQWIYDTDKHWNNCTANDGERMNEAVHSFGEWTLVVEATENSVGSKKRVCSVCGYEETQEVAKLDHTHSADDNATWKMDESGHWHECSMDYEVIDLADHTYGDWTVETEASESQEGSRKRTCDICGYVDRQTISALNHTHTADTTEWKKDADGHWYNCIGNDGEKLNLTTHTYGDWTVEVEASESQEGSQVRTCSVCGYVERQAIPSLNHTHTADTTEWESDAENHWHNCVINDGTKLDSAAHTYGDWKEETAATETQDGSKTRTCTVCGYVERQAIPSLNHTHTADTTEWESDAENHWHNCVINDGTKLDSAAHTFGDWTTVTSATEQTEGLEKRVCTVCQYEETRAISKLEDSDNQGGNTTSEEGTTETTEKPSTSEATTEVKAENPTKGEDATVGQTSSEGNDTSVSGSQTSSEDKGSQSSSTEEQPAAVGTTLPDTGNVTYKVNGNQTVEYEANKTAKGTVKIPATVEKNGVTYKVTTVAASAFKNNKKITSVNLSSNITTVGKDAFSGCTKLKSVTIGKNITTIGKNAFKGCKKLKTITINSTKLKKSKVGSNAFKGISSKATIKVPKSKYKEYKKWFKSKGLSSKVKIKKK